MHDYIVYGGVLCFAVILKLFSKYYSPRISRAFYPKYDSLEANLKIHWNAYVLSTVHAIVVTFWAGYFIVFDENVNEKPHGPAGRRVRLVLAFSSGYFLHDMLEMLRYWHQFGRRSEIAHHLVSLTGSFYVTMTGQLPYATCIQLLHEFSTPLVNLRWFILTIGIGKSRKTYKFVCTAMMISFFICRVITIPWFWKSVLPECLKEGAYCNTLEIKMMAIFFIAMDCLNLYWFRLMFKICSRVITDKIKEVRNRKRLHQTFEEISPSDVEFDEKDK